MQASAQQRAGRAGRIRAGKCYRLYPESEFHKLRVDTVPEMQRTHMAAVVLQLRAMGIQNVLKFNYLSVRFFLKRFFTQKFLQRPSSFAMICGIELLYALNAIDKHGNLTDDGEKMAELPLPPAHSRVSIFIVFVSSLQVQILFTDTVKQ